MGKLCLAGIALLALPANAQDVQEFRSEEFGVKLEFPKGWELKKGEEAGLLLWLENGPISVVLHQSKDPESSPEKAARVFEENTKGVGIEVNVVRDEKLKKSPGEWLLREYTMSYADLNSYQANLYVKRGTILFQLSIAVDKEPWQKHKEIVQKILDSFSLTDPKTTEDKPTNEPSERPADKPSGDKFPKENASEKFVLDLGGEVKMEFVRIKAGKFTMGDKDEWDAAPHEVTITKDYWMQATETTLAQWGAVMGTKTQEHMKTIPATKISWGECDKFLSKLNEKAKEQLQGKMAKLPTEAEWEYACRAGSTTKWCFGDNRSDLDDYAFRTEKDRFDLSPVGELKPNAWGLYDMHGNAYEWCEDWYGEYPSEAVTDPTGPPDGERCVIRGGASNSSADGVASAHRSSWKSGFGESMIGMRVALHSSP